MGVVLSRRVLGLACAFLNTGLSSVGFVLQRKAHLIKEQESIGRSSAAQSSVSRSPLWILGIVLTIAAALPDVAAYTLIPEVLCATVACFRLVVVCALGHVFLGEHLRQEDVRGISICTLGTVLCVIFGPGGDEGTSSTARLHHPKVVAYSVVGLGVLAVVLVIVHADSFPRVTRIWPALPSSKLYRFSLPVATALAYAVEKVFNTELGFIEKPENVFLEPLWLGMVIAVGALGITDFYLNTRAAERMPVHLFAPLTFAFATSLQCLQAMIIFDEFINMSFFGSLATLLGVGLALTGALLIQPSQYETNHRQMTPSHSSPGTPTSSKNKSEEPQADCWNAWAWTARARRGWTACQQTGQAVWMRNLKTALKKRRSYGNEQLHLV